MVTLTYVNDKQETKLTGQLIYENDTYMLINTDNEIKFNNEYLKYKLIQKTQITNLINNEK